MLVRALTRSLLVVLEELTTTRKLMNYCSLASDMRLLDLHGTPIRLAKQTSHCTPACLQTRTPSMRMRDIGRLSLTWSPSKLTSPS